MRVSSSEIKSIKEIVSALDPKAQIYLFGSRVDDKKRGGDLDILIISSVITEKNRRAIKLMLYDTLGEQKIDLLIASDTSKPFIQIALEHGVLL